MVRSESNQLLIRASNSFALINILKHDKKKVLKNINKRKRVRSKRLDIRRSSHRSFWIGAAIARYIKFPCYKHDFPQQHQKPIYSYILPNHTIEGNRHVNLLKSLSKYILTFDI